MTDAIAVHRYQVVVKSLIQKRPIALSAGSDSIRHELAVEASLRVNACCPAVTYAQRLWLQRLLYVCVRVCVCFCVFVCVRVYMCVCLWKYTQVHKS